MIGSTTVTDAQANELDKGAIGRLHIIGPRGGWIGSILLDEERARELIIDLSAKLHRASEKN